MIQKKSSLKNILIIVHVCILLSFFPFTVFSGDSFLGGLFTETAAQLQRAASVERQVIRQRLVGINYSQLCELEKTDHRQSVSPGVLILNLFEDVNLNAHIHRVEKAFSGGFSFVGHIEGVPGGEVIFAVTGDIVSANISVPGHVYQVRYVSGGVHKVQEVDQTAFPQELPPVPVHSEKKAGPAAISGDSGDYIDIMVVYTAAARSAAGGTTAIENLIDLAVSETNTGYSNSGVNQRLSLVHTAEVDYSEASFNWSTTLSRLRSTSDGYMDDVHTWRDTYGADEVVLIVNNTGYCGIAYVMQYVSTSFAPYAFAVVSRVCATGYYSFAHELGHTMGSAHDRDNASVLGAYDYSFGYQAPDEAFRTIMSYNCPGGCTRVNYWSNPDNTYGGQPMGVLYTDPLAADNRRSLNNTANTVANFRQSVTSPTITVTSPNGGESWQVGSSQTITWTSVGMVGNVKIEYSANNGSSWLDIIASTENDGTHPWTVPDAVSSQCLVRVGETDGSPSDTSDAVFSIVPVPTVTVTSPNGGEEWQPGTIYDITWNYTGLNGDVTIDLYKGGVFNSNIGITTVNSGSFSWDIPLDFATGDDYRVRIYQGVVEDYSDNDFSVAARSQFRASPDFNRDGLGDVIWRYDAPEGYNAVWLLGTSGGAGAVAEASSTKISPADLLVKMNFDTSEGIFQENVWEYAENLWRGPLKDGFAGETGWDNNTGFTAEPFAIDNNTWQNISGVMASSVSDPRDDPQAVELLEVADQNWKIAGYGDFNDDGKVDLVWSNVYNAHNCVWYMDDTSFAGYGRLPDGSTTDWVLGGVGDFDLDGHPDMIWNNEVDGRNGVWYLDGVQLKGIDIMTAGASVQWKLCGTGDFNSDGKVDLVWRNTTDGRNAVWYMDGVELSSVGWLDSVADQNWKLRGTGDFNNDGKTDLIWTYATDGRNCIWYLDGITLTGVEFITTVTDTTWKIEN